MYSVFLAGNNTIGQAMPLSVKEPYLDVYVNTGGSALGSHNIVMERIIKAPAAAYTTKLI